MQEYVKELESNEKIIKKIDKQILALNKELKNARRNYNREDYSRDEYLEIKEEIETELKELENKKSSLSTDKEKKIIVIKKAVPILKNCLEKYNTLSIKNKNKLLKGILKAVYYTKNKKGTDFDITIDFII